MNPTEAELRGQLILAAGDVATVSGGLFQVQTDLNSATYNHLNTDPAWSASGHPKFHPVIEGQPLRTETGRITFSRPIRIA